MFHPTDISATQDGRHVSEQHGLADTARRIGHDIKEKGRHLLDQTKQFFSGEKEEGLTDGITQKAGEALYYMEHNLGEDATRRDVHYSKD